MPDSEYFALPHLGSTDIKRLLHSPAEFQRGRQPGGGGRSSAMLLGSALHSLLLGGPDVHRLEEFADLRSKRARAAANAAATMGVIALPRPVHDKALRMVDAVLGNPIAGPMIAESRPEDRELAMGAVIDGIPRKAKLDLRHGGDTVDVKTTSETELTPEALAAASVQFGYATQTVCYSDVRLACTGSRPDRHIIIWVQSCEPHDVRLSVFDAPSLDQARRDVDLALARWLRAELTGDWWDVQPSDLDVDAVTVP